MVLFDTHTHLQDERYADATQSVIDRAYRSGVTHILCCGSAESDWEKVARIAKNNPGVIPAFGIHPWYVADRTSTWESTLLRMLQHYPSAAVGEIGIDKLVDINFNDQVEVFTAQLRIARGYRRPVSIHCRKAWEPLILALKEESRLGEIRGALHSYSGSAELVPIFESLGFYLSFSGAITHERNRRGKEAARAVSSNRLLIETDSPDILPAGAAEQLNEPANLHLVNSAVAQIRGISPEAAAEMTSRNGQRLFGSG